jgi:hypothetical protein
VVERPRVDNKCLYTHYYWRLMLDKIETRRSHLGRPMEHSEGKGGKSAMAILMFQCSSPRLCRLRTEGLVPVSRYCTYQSHAGVYGPGKPNTWMPTDVWFCLHCFNGWLGRETGYGLTDQSAGVLWIVSGTLFPSSSDYVKGCHI